MSDIRSLSVEERDQIEAAFSILQGVRNEPAQLEHNPPETLDAEFEDVTEEDTLAALNRIERTAPDTSPSGEREDAQ